MNRRSFFRGLLGTGSALAVPVLVAAHDTDSVRHVGEWTLTWEGWQRRADVWALFGFWRATRVDDVVFIYSTTGGIIGTASTGYALNLTTREGWAFLAPDTPPAECEQACQRALQSLIATIHANDYPRVGGYR